MWLSGHFGVSKFALWFMFQTRERLLIRLSAWPFKTSASQQSGDVSYHLLSPGPWLEHRVRAGGADVHGRRCGFLHQFPADQGLHRRRNQLIFWIFSNMQMREIIFFIKLNCLVAEFFEQFFPVGHNDSGGASVPLLPDDDRVPAAGLHPA